MKVEIFEGKNDFVNKVEVVETYPSSSHYFLKVFLKDCGSPSQAAEFCIREADWGREGCIVEGYGIFRREYAIGLAKLLAA